MAKVEKEKVVANYRVIIEPDQETGTGKPGFTAYVPKLGIADGGKTVDEALKNIRAMIKFHLDCLLEEGAEIPTPDHQEALVVTTPVVLPSSKARRFQQLAVA